MSLPCYRQAERPRDTAPDTDLAAGPLTLPGSWKGFEETQWPGSHTGAHFQPPCEDLHRRLGTWNCAASPGSPPAQNNPWA